jgi:T5SS/PEP-CTERM-associated repeat protein/autotransporter-associated beta strand protein
MLAGLLLSPSAQACADGDTFWTGNISDDWDNALNWTTGLPSSSRSAVFASGSSQAVVSGFSFAEACELRIARASLQTDLLVDGIALNSGQASIGQTAGTFGRMELDGEFWFVSARGGFDPWVRLGRSGTGELLLRNGAGLFGASQLRIGDASSGDGSVTARGGSVIQLSEDLTIGRQGNGEIRIESGSEVSGPEIYVARFSGSSGQATVTGSGSLLEADAALRVGDTGSGALDLLAGGQASSLSGAIGGATAGSGVVMIQDADSRWDVDQELRVGDQGTAELEVIGGGRVVADDLVIGWGASSSGSAFVGDVGTALQARQSLTVGRAGSGVLTLFIGGEMILGGAAQTSTLTLAELAGSTGTLHLFNNGLDNGRPGTLLAETVDGGAGQATVHFEHQQTDYEFRNGLNEPIVLTGSVNLLHDGSGTTRVFASNRTGDTRVHQGSLSLEQGSAGSSSAEVRVGQFNGDDATLRLITNSLLESGTAIIADQVSSTGQAAVVGPGSRWTQNGPLFVGREGSGELTVRGLATVEADNILVASTPGSEGVLNIGNGADPGFIVAGQISGGGGSAIINFNHSDPDYNLRDGVSPILLTGSSELRHLGTGATRLSGDHSYFGPTLVEQGTLRLADSASIDTPDTVLSIGEVDQQTARFEMASESLATVDILRVGRVTGSRGELVISGFGGGSTELRSLRQMILGGSGEAAVTLGETAHLVSGEQAIVGRFGPGDGQVSLVDGGRWTVESGGLVIGDAGSGEVIIGNGGELSVLDGPGLGVVLLGAQANGEGVLVIGDGVSAGSLRAMEIAAGPGGGGLVFDHAEALHEFAADGAPIRLSGSMDVAHVGSGTTRVLGSNTVDGLLQVAFGGTLVLNGLFTFDAVSATSGGRLAASGLIDGPVTIGPTGRLAPGDGVGRMEISGDLSLAGLAVLEMALAVEDPASTENDRLEVNGNLVLDGRLDVTALPGFGPGRYRLINYLGTLDDQGLEISSLPPGFPIGEASIDTSIPGQVDLIVGGQLADGLFADRFQTP